MKTLKNRINDIEKRLDNIESFLSMKSNNNFKEQTDDDNDDVMINGIHKSELRKMFYWAEHLELKHLTRSDFDELKKWNMLKIFYPNSPDNYDDIKIN